MTQPNRLLTLAMLALAGCITDYKVVEGDGPNVIGGAGTSGAAASGLCKRGGGCYELSVAHYDKLDLLFVVDNSASMAEEQAALSRALPRLIDVLTTGDRTRDGVEDFPPIKSMHLGVVTSDLGLPGVNTIVGCEGHGDDAILNGLATPTTPNACSAPFFFPSYLTFEADANPDRNQLAIDFACLTNVGIEGCGFEQPLEAALKAVWPGDQTTFDFVVDPESGLGGLGQAGPGFPNGDFIRNDPNDPSIVGIVIVTDEEDCSSEQMDHFRPDHSDRGLNTRCFYEGQKPEPNNLFDIARYIGGFKALRPDHEDLVFFAGIVGVPPELVSREALDAADLDTPSGSAAFFDGLLNAPKMQELIDPQGNDDPSDDNLAPSCGSSGPGSDSTARAYPPRRIVEVARGFGSNGVIHSICQDDFSPAIDAIVERIARRTGSTCLPAALERGEDGKVACDLIWELPAESVAVPGAPTACSQRSFLTPRTGTGPNGGKLCTVTQLPAPARDTALIEGNGFYYDDFSEALSHCAMSSSQRITYTPAAQPPIGVSANLDCAD